MVAWSREFQEFWARGDSALDFAQFERCLLEFQRNHNRRAMVQWALAALCFGPGLWLLYQHDVAPAAVLLILAGYFNLNSANHMLFSEILNGQRLLAMFINSQALSIKALEAENQRKGNAV